MKKRIEIRCTEEERERASFYASLCDRSISGYVRLILFEENPKQALPKEYLLLCRALSAVLNNLTQIASVSNTLNLPLADKTRKFQEDVRSRLYFLRIAME